MSQKSTRRHAWSMGLSSLALIATLNACGNQTPPATETTTPEASNTETTAPATSDLKGDVAIDGSSTVFPVTEAMAEEFQAANPNVRITVGVSGTGGGFEKFCSGETDISNASRPIKEKEVKACADAGIEYIEVPVAFDALSVIVNKENTWATCLTTAELQKIWSPDAQGKIDNWKQVRDSFPDQPLTLYGPGTDSGTFDYFTDAINGEEGASRGDYTASEDDNVVVQGVANDKGALGYFGFAYYEENADNLIALGVDDGDAANGEGCVVPSVATVNDGTYQPLARPIFIYVSKKALERPEVKAFVDFYMATENAPLVSEAGYIALPDDVYPKAQARIAEGKVGSVFEGGSTVGVKLHEVL